ncbi:hypothetical protein DL93DRAFT_1700348 [Clavulina sp. PMI_390]|nr:hypothetical protein DL93DRAFT_1700348 [Clavulina sp. PMI_390]
MLHVRKASALLAHDIAIVRASLPGIAILRSQLAAGPTSVVAREAGIISATLMSECLTALDKNAPEEGEVDAEMATGLSYEELYYQAYGSPGAEKDPSDDALDKSHVLARARSLEPLRALVTVDTSEKSTEALAKHRLMTFSLGVIKAAKAFPTFAHRTDPMRDPTIPDFHDLMVLMWREILVSCSVHKVSSPAHEAVSGDLVFLLEEWSVHAPEDHARAFTSSSDLETSFIPQMVSILFPPAVIPTIIAHLANVLSLDRSANASNLFKFYSQLWIVHSRVTDRPGVKPWVIQEWQNAFDRAYFSAAPPGDPSEPKVCACVGCVKVRLVEMRCTGCKRQTYCSASCQKTDWKFHKMHCNGRDGDGVLISQDS